MRTYVASIETEKACTVLNGIKLNYEKTGTKYIDLRVMWNLYKKTSIIERERECRKEWRFRKAFVKALSTIIVNFLYMQETMNEVREKLATGVWCKNLKMVIGSDVLVQLLI